MEENNKIQKHRLLKPLDLPIILLSLAALLSSVLLVKQGKGEEKLLVIGCPEGEFVYPLSKDAVYKIQGAIGISEIVISGGKARFLDSPCPSKTCVMTGELSEAGEWAACLPNEIFIRIEGKEDSLDALAQ